MPGMKLDAKLSAKTLITFNTQNINEVVLAKEGKYVNIALKSPHMATFTFE